MAQYSVDLSINTKGYTDGIEEAKQSNAQFDSSVIKTDKSLASLKKEVGQARRAVENLAFAYAKMSKAEQQSGQGKALKRQLDEAKKYAADLKDLAEDVNNEIKNMASDTAGWDAMKEGIGVAKDGLTALATVVADVTGDEDAFKEVLLQVARVQSIANAAITIGNALQKQSALMVGIRRIQEIALKKAINAETSATVGATAAQKAFNIVAKANPYVLLATAILAVVGAIGTYIAMTHREKNAAELEAEEQRKVQAEWKKTQETVNQSVSKTISSYMSLAAQWKSLSNEHQKTEWIEKNKSKFAELGLNVNNAKQAEDVFVNNTQAVVNALKARAEAEAWAKTYEEWMQKKIENDLNGTIANGRYYKVAKEGMDAMLSVTEEEAKALGIQRQSMTYMSTTAGAIAVATNNRLTAEQAIALNTYRQAEAAKKRNKENEKGQKILDQMTKSYADQYTAESAVSSLLTSTKPKGGGGSSKKEKTEEEIDIDVNADEIDLAKMSLEELEELLQKIMNLRKGNKGLIPTLDIYQFRTVVDNFQKAIKKKKIELGVELPPSELDEVNEKINTLKANQLRPELRLDPKQFQEQLKELENEKHTILVNIGYEVEPKVDTSDAKEVEKIMKDVMAPKEMNLDFSALKEKLPEELGEQVQETVDRYQEVKDAREQLTEIMNDEGASDAAIAAAQAGLEQLDEEWQKLVEDVNLYNEANKEVEKTNKKMKNLAKTVTGVGNAVSTAAGLFTALGEASDDKQAKVLGIVAQAIATIALSFAQALSSCSTWVEWLAFGITGLATVVTMVSQIKNLNQGYAKGGIIPGSSYSGDLLTANVNSGEMILNKRQQRNLFDAIDQNKLGGVGQPQVVTVEGVIRGKDLLLVQKNYNSIGSHSGQTIQI